MGMYIYIHGCPKGKHTHRSCLMNNADYKNLVKSLTKSGWKVALIDLPNLKDTSDYWSDGGLKYRDSYISKIKQVVEVLELSDQRKYNWYIGGISYGGLHALMGASKLQIFKKYVAILPVVKLNALSEFSKYCNVDYFDPFNELLNLKYSKGYISYNISDTRVNGLLSEILYDSLINTGADLKRKIFNKGGHKINSDLRFVLKFLNEE